MSPLRFAGSRLQSLPLRIKLLLILVGTAGIAVSLVAGGIIAYEAMTFRESATEELNALSDVIGGGSSAALAFSDSVAAQENLEALRLRPTIRFAVLLRPGSEVLARYFRDASIVRETAQEVPLLGTRLASDEIAVHRPIQYRGERVGTIIIGSDLSAFTERLHQYVWIAVVTALLGVLLAIGLSLRAQKAVTAPIYAIAHTARRVAASGKYSERVRRTNADEIGVLVDDFNAMLAGIEKRDESLKAFHDELERQVLALQEEALRRRKVQEDLSDREEQLRQAQKLEAIGLLAGGVAHDFNNILTVINGYSQLLISRVPQDSPLRPGLETIKESGDRAAALTRQLLALSRKKASSPAVLDPGSVIAGMDRMLRRLVGEPIEVSYIPRHGAAQIKADPTHIEQIILNLVVNARDAMPAGGRLVIETYVESPDLVPSDTDGDGAPRLVLEVRDNGTGIPPEVLPHIFEPFFTTKETGRGTGLGLSTVKGIVEHEGGSIAIESQPGMGTTFRIFLPVTQESPCARGATAPSRTAIRLTGATILVVEDQGDVRKFVVSVLREAGGEVLEAEYGSRAIELAKAHEGAIDLVLTDIIMPQMNGLDTYRAIEQLRPGVPVLYMSGYADLGAADAATLNVTTNLIEKPFTPEALLRRVAATIDETAPGRRAPRTEFAALSLGKDECAKGPDPA